MSEKQGHAFPQENPPPYNTVGGQAYAGQVPQSAQYAYPPQQPHGAPPGYAPIVQHQPGPQGGMVLAPPGTVPTQVIVANPIPMTNQPPDHMIFNIFMTLFCCWPIGIFAIMKSMACRDAKYRGDLDQANRLSNDARRLGYWTLGVGIFTVVVSVLLIIVMYAVYIPSLLRH